MEKNPQTVNRAALGLLGQAWKTAVIGIYLVLWSERHKLRMWLVGASRWTLAISLILFSVEFFCEALGAPAAAEALRVVEHHKDPLLLSIAIAIALVLYHEFQESRKPEYEFRLIGHLQELMAARCERRPETEQTSRALQTMHYAFGFAHVAHVSICTMKDDELVILPKNLFPNDISGAFSVRLKPKDGIAGRVYDDKFPRYVPRIKLFGRLFPHGIKFKYSEEIDGQVRRFRFTAVEAEVNVFVATEEKQLPFKSFLSVPIRRADDTCIGVLNIDFSRCNPLDSNGIATAVAFAYVLGDIMGVPLVTPPAETVLENSSVKV